MSEQDEVEDTAGNSGTISINFARVGAIVGLFLTFIAIIAYPVQWINNVNAFQAKIETLSETRKAEQIEQDRRLTVLELRSKNLEKSIEQQNISINRMDVKLSIIMGALGVKFQVSQDGTVQPVAENLADKGKDPDYSNGP